MTLPTLFVTSALSLCSSWIRCTCSREDRPAGDRSSRKALELRCRGASPRTTATIVASAQPRSTVYRQIAGGDAEGNDSGRSSIYQSGPRPGQHCIEERWRARLLRHDCVRLIQVIRLAARRGFRDGSALLTMGTRGASGGHVRRLAASPRFAMNSHNSATRAGSTDANTLSAAAVRSAGRRRERRHSANASRPDAPRGSREGAETDSSLPRRLSGASKGSRLGGGGAHRPRRTTLAAACHGACLEVLNIRRLFSPVLITRRVTGLSIADRCLRCRQR